MKTCKPLKTKGRVVVILFGVVMGAVLYLFGELPWHMIWAMPLTAILGCRESFFGLGPYGEE